MAKSNTPKVEKQFAVTFGDGIEKRAVLVKAYSPNMAIYLGAKKFNRENKDPVIVVSEINVRVI